MATWQQTKLQQIAAAARARAAAARAAAKKKKAPPKPTPAEIIKALRRGVVLPPPKKAPPAPPPIIGPPAPPIVRKILEERLKAPPAPPPKKLVGPPAPPKPTPVLPIVGLPVTPIEAALLKKGGEAAKAAEMMYKARTGKVLPAPPEKVKRVEPPAPPRPVAPPVKPPVAPPFITPPTAKEFVERFKKGELSPPPVKPPVKVEEERARELPSTLPFDLSPIERTMISRGGVQAQTGISLYEKRTGKKFVEPERKVIVEELTPEEKREIIREKIEETTGKPFLFPGEKIAVKRHEFIEKKIEEAEAELTPQEITREVPFGPALPPFLREKFLAGPLADRFAIDESGRMVKKVTYTKEPDLMFEKQFEIEARLGDLLTIADNIVKKFNIGKVVDIDVAPDITTSAYIASGIKKAGLTSESIAKANREYNETKNYLSKILADVQASPEDTTWKIEHKEYTNAQATVHIQNVLKELNENPPSITFEDTKAPGYTYGGQKFDLTQPNALQNIYNYQKNVTQFVTEYEIESKSLKKLGASDDIVFLINNTNPTISKNLETAFRKTLLEQTTGTTTTRSQSDFNKLFQDAYTSLPFDKKADYNLKYLDWTTINPWEIQHYPGGKEYIKRNKQKIINQYESMTYAEQQDGIWQAKHPDKKLFDQMFNKYVASGGIYSKYGASADIEATLRSKSKTLSEPKGPKGKQLRMDVILDRITLSEPEMKDKYYQMLPFYAKAYTTVHRAAVKGAVAMITLPEVILEEGVGRLLTGKAVDFIPAKFTIAGKDIPLPVSRNFIQQKLDKYMPDVGQPGGLIETTISQIYTGVTEQRAGAPKYEDWLKGKKVKYDIKIEQWNQQKENFLKKNMVFTKPKPTAPGYLDYAMEWGKESEAWRRAKKYPVETILGTFGELFGYWMGGKVLGVGARAVKTGIGAVTTGAVKYTIKPIARYTPRIYKGVSALKTSKLVLKIKEVTAKITKVKTEIQSNQTKISGLRKRIANHKKAYQAGKLTSSQYNKLVKPLTKQLNTLSKSNTASKATLETLRAQEKSFSRQLAIAKAVPGRPLPGVVRPFVSTRIGRETAEWIKRRAFWGETPTTRAGISALTEAGMLKYGPKALTKRGYQRITGARKAPLSLKKGISEYHQISIDPVTGKAIIVSKPEVSTIKDLFRGAEAAQHPITREIQLGGARMGPPLKYTRLPIDVKLTDYSVLYPRGGRMVRGVQPLRVIARTPMDALLLDIAKNSNLVVAGSKAMKLQTQTGLKWLLRKARDWDFIYRGSIKETESMARKMANTLTKNTGIQYTISRGRHPGIYTIYQKGTRVADTSVADIVASVAKKGKFFPEKISYTKIGDLQVLDLKTLIENKLAMGSLQKDMIKTLTDLELMTGMKGTELRALIRGTSPYGKIIQVKTTSRSLSTLVKDRVDKAIVTAARKNNLILGGSGGMKLQAKLSLALLKRKAGDWDFLFNGGFQRTRRVANAFAKELEGQTGRKGFNVIRSAHPGSFRIKFKGKSIADITSSRSPRIGGHLAYQPWLERIPTITIEGLKVAELEYLLERKILMARYGILKRFMKTKVGIKEVPSKTLQDIQIMTGLTKQELYQFEPQYWGGVIKRVTGVYPRYPKLQWIGRSRRLTPEGMETPYEWFTLKGDVPTWPWKTGPRVTRRTVLRKGRPAPWLEETAVKTIRVPPKRLKDSMAQLDYIYSQPAKADAWITMRMSLAKTTEEELAVMAGLAKYKLPLGYRYHLGYKFITKPPTTWGKVTYYMKKAWEKYGDWWSKIKGYRDYEVLPTGEVIPIRAYRLLTPDEVVTLSKAIKKAEMGDARPIGEFLGTRTSIDGKKIITQTGEPIDAKLIGKILKPGKKVTQEKTLRLAKEIADYRAGVGYKPVITPYSATESAVVAKYYIPREPRPPTYPTPRHKPYVKPYRTKYRPTYQPSYPPLYKPPYEIVYEPSYQPPPYEPPYEPPYPYPYPYSPTYRPEPYLARPVPPPFILPEKKKKKGIPKKPPKTIRVEYKERKFILPTFIGAYRQRPYKPMRS